MNTEKEQKSADKETKETKDRLKETVSSLVPETRTVSAGTSAGGDVDSPETLRIGETLGKYEIRKKLGQGGMGTVYLAYDPMIEREVAIKVLTAQIAAKPELLQRFLAEAKATGKLNHPNVVAIYDIGNHESTYYIVMELLGGGSLSELTAVQGACSWQDACRMTAEAADGLAAAHSAGLVHRDIKPENLMLTGTGLVKVVDFGLSKLIDAANDTREALTKAGQILGTPQYMSPEQFQGQTLDARSDIYSLGGTFYRLLTGQLPYQHCASIMQVMYAHLEEPVPDPCKVVNDIPAACKDIVAHAMAKSAADRYQDAGEMAAELKSLLYGGSAAAKEDEPAPAESYQPLETVAIVEPSKIPALMLEDSFKKAGASSVQVCKRAADALKYVETNVPDVVVTAMQISDMRGIELVSRLREDRRLQRSMLVLNSSDSTIHDLISAGRSGVLASVSKKTKPHEILQAIHACTFFETQSGPLTEAVDPTTVRTRVICDSDRIPDIMADQFRRLGLLDLQIITIEHLGSGNAASDDVDLTLVLRTVGDADPDMQLFANLMSRVDVDRGTVAVLQLAGEEIQLRGVRRKAFTAVTHAPLDDARLTRLLQVCR
jgi:serine/threonine protein kinase